MKLIYCLENTDLHSQLINVLDQNSSDTVLIKSSLHRSASLWLWLSLTLIQQAIGFSALFQFSDLMTLPLTSFLVSKIDSAEHFQAESCKTEKGQTDESWQSITLTQKRQEWFILIC